MRIELNQRVPRGFVWYFLHSLHHSTQLAHVWFIICLLMPINISSLSAHDFSQNIFLILKLPSLLSLLGCMRIFYSLITNRCVNAINPPALYCKYFSISHFFHWGNRVVAIVAFLRCDDIIGQPTGLYSSYWNSGISHCKYCRGKTYIGIH